MIGKTIEYSIYNISGQFLHHFHPGICWALQNVQNLNIKSEKICIYNILSYIFWGNCPPKFWQNRRSCRAVLRITTCPPSFRYLAIYAPVSISVFGSYIYILVREPKYCSHWTEQQNDQKISNCLNSSLVFSQ